MARGVWYLWRTVFVLGGLLPLSCTAEHNNSEPGQEENSNGSVSLALQLGSGQTISTFAYVIVGPRSFSKMGTIDVSASQNPSAFIGGIPAGTGFSISLTGTSLDGITSCAGSAAFDIVGGLTSPVQVSVRCHEQKRTGSVSVNGTINICPVIDGISVTPAEVVVGGRVSLASSAHDSDAGPSALSYSWTATNGVLSNPSALSPTLTCNAVGKSTLKLTVSDGDCSDSYQATVTCRAPTTEDLCLPAGGICSEREQCCSQRCDLRQGPGDGTGVCGDERLLEGPLATMTETLKRNDFRLSPPPVLAEFASPAADGSTDIKVVFAADSRLLQSPQLILPIDGAPIVLTAQPGVAGAALTPGTGVSFTGNVPVPFADVHASQQRLRKAAADMNQTTIPRFNGHELVAQDLIPALDEQISTIPLTHFPFSIDATRSLTITDSSVTQDPTRTFDVCSGTGTPLGPWTFGKLMTDMAGTMPPSDFVQAWLSTFLTDQSHTDNGLTVPANTKIFGITTPFHFSAQTFQSLIDGWPKLPDGSLDLAQAPFRLIAIVNRIDLAGNSAYGAVSGSEGRFVFQMVSPTEAGCKVFNFTVIFEFGVPKSTCSELRGWAQQWVALGEIPLTAPAFNSALQAITDQFATSNADPSKPNGSALNQLRTNSHTGFFPSGGSIEIWQLREYHLTQRRSSAPLLNLASVAQTPTEPYNAGLLFGFGSGGPLAPILGRWILDHVSDTDPALPPTYTVPLTLGCSYGPDVAPCSGRRAFRGASIDNIQNRWDAPGPANPALNVFSLNTCDGCHGIETGTQFLHISTDGTGIKLSRFLTGESVSDPRDFSVSHTYNDLLRRKGILQQLAGSFCNKFAVPKELERSIFPSPIPPLSPMPLLSSH